jgi:hypothetical protein
METTARAAVAAAALVPALAATAVVDILVEVVVAGRVNDAPLGRRRRVMSTRVWKTPGGMHAAGRACGEIVGRGRTAMR